MKITESKLRQIIRSVIREETEYQKFFKKELEKTGKSIPQMSDEEKKAFFNKIDKAWKGKGESVDELTKAQEKLPPALKKAIQKKEKKESVNEAKHSFKFKHGIKHLQQKLNKGYSIEGGDEDPQTYYVVDKNRKTVGTFHYDGNTVTLLDIPNGIFRFRERILHVNEAKVIVYNEKTGERYEVLSGKAKGDLLIAMKALQSSAPSHMKYSIKESVNEAKFDASAYKPAPEWKNKMQQRSEFGNLLSPNDVKFLVNSQTKTFTKGNNLIVTDGNRWMVFNTSSPVSKVKRLGNAPQSIKDLHSNS